MADHVRSPPQDLPDLRKKPPNPETGKGLEPPDGTDGLAETVALIFAQLQPALGETPPRITKSSSRSEIAGAINFINNNPTSEAPELSLNSIVADLKGTRASEWFDSDDSVANLADRSLLFTQLASVTDLDLAACDYTHAMDNLANGIVMPKWEEHVEGAWTLNPFYSAHYQASLVALEQSMQSTMNTPLGNAMTRSRFDSLSEKRDARRRALENNTPQSWANSASSLTIAAAGQAYDVTIAAAGQAYDVTTAAAGQAYDVTTAAAGQGASALSEALRQATGTFIASIVVDSGVEGALDLKIDDNTIYIRNLDGNAAGRFLTPKTYFARPRTSSAIPDDQAWNQRYINQAWKEEFEKLVESYLSEESTPEDKGLIAFRVGSLVAIQSAEPEAKLPLLIEYVNLPQESTRDIIPTRCGHDTNYLQALEEALNTNADYATRMQSFSLAQEFETKQLDQSLATDGATPYALRRALETDGNYNTGNKNLNRNTFAPRMTKEDVDFALGQFDAVGRLEESPATCNTRMRLFYRSLSLLMATAFTDENTKHWLEKLDALFFEGNKVVVGNDIQDSSNPEDTFQKWNEFGNSKTKFKLPKKFSSQTTGVRYEPRTAENLLYDALKELRESAPNAPDGRESSLWKTVAKDSPSHTTLTFDKAKPYAIAVLGQMPWKDAEWVLEDDYYVLQNGPNHDTNYRNTLKAGQDGVGYCFDNDIYRTFQELSPDNGAKFELGSFQQCTPQPSQGTATPPSYEYAAIDFTQERIPQAIRNTIGMEAIVLANYMTWRILPSVLPGGLPVPTMALSCLETAGIVYVVNSANKGYFFEDRGNVYDNLKAAFNAIVDGYGDVSLWSQIAFGLYLFKVAAKTRLPLAGLSRKRKAQSAITLTIDAGSAVVPYFLMGGAMGSTYLLLLAGGLVSKALYFAFKRFPTGERYRDGSAAKVMFPEKLEYIDLLARNSADVAAFLSIVAQVLGSIDTTTFATDLPTLVTASVSLGILGLSGWMTGAVANWRQKRNRIESFENTLIAVIGDYSPKDQEGIRRSYAALTFDGRINRELYIEALVASIEGTNTNIHIVIDPESSALYEPYTVALYTDGRPGFIRLNADRKAFALTVNNLGRRRYQIFQGAMKLLEQAGSSETAKTIVRNLLLPTGLAGVAIMKTQFSLWGFIATYFEMRQKQEFAKKTIGNLWKVLPELIIMGTILFCGPIRQNDGLGVTLTSKTPGPVVKVAEKAEDVVVVRLYSEHFKTKYQQSFIKEKQLKLESGENRLYIWNDDPGIVIRSGTPEYFETLKKLKNVVVVETNSRRIKKGDVGPAIVDWWRKDAKFAARLYAKKDFKALINENAVDEREEDTVITEAREALKRMNGLQSGAPGTPSGPLARFGNAARRTVGR